MMMVMTYIFAYFYTVMATNKNTGKQLMFHIVVGVYNMEISVPSL